MSHIKYIFPFVIMALLCFFGTQSYAAQSLTRAEYALFTEAKRAFDSKDYPAAAETLEIYFRQKGSKHNYGYQLYGIILLNTKNYERAVQILEKGVKEYPKNANLWQNLGMAYYNTKKIFKAAKSFEKAYTVSEKKAPSLAYTAAHFFVQAKKYKDAIRLLSHITLLKSAKPLWFQALGQAYFYDGQRKNAALTIEKGLGRFKENASLWRMLGYFYYQLKNREKAASAYEIAYTFEAPTENEAQQLALLYYSLYAPYSGKRLLAFKNTPIATLSYISVLYAQAGDLTNAIDIARLAVKKKYSYDLQFRLGILFYRKKSFAQATNIFRTLAKRESEYAEKGQWMLVEIAWDKQDWKSLATELQTLADMQGPLSGRAVQLLEVVEQLASGKLKSFADSGE